jgi:hypothetical protein
MQVKLAYNLHSNSPSLPLKNKEILDVNYRQVLPAFNYQRLLSSDSLNRNVNYRYLREEHLSLNKKEILWARDSK